MNRLSTLHRTVQLVGTIWMLKAVTIQIIAMVYRTVALSGKVHIKILLQLNRKNQITEIFYSKPHQLQKMEAMEQRPIADEKGNEDNENEGKQEDERNGEGENDFNDATDTDDDDEKKIHRALINVSCLILAENALVRFKHLLYN